MPSAFFAFSEGKVEVIGSTKAMKEFLNDESIKRRFLECAKANPEVESSDDEEPIAESSPSLGDAFKWDKERTPFWWPSNLTFGNMKSVNVASCDRILDAYRKMLIKSRINQITEMPNQPWLELKKWADTTVEEVEQKICFAKI
ncbi:uncharacterized protein [Clytia hemisphaerica]|uniref:Uncharacterized protein n=1 Tax=Clytia hemisphaerica TaxID=252671 RepID=A0A7M5V3L4_9CNID